MEFRYVGNSGFKISEITYGNWLTHGSQVENDQAKACVRAALMPASRRSTPPTYMRNTSGRDRARRGPEGERRESLEILTKVFGPTGPKGHNDVGLSRKHIMESINGSLTRLQTDYVDVYQCHRYDYETRSMRPWGPSPTWYGWARCSTSEFEWTAQQIQDGHDMAEGSRLPPDLQPAAVLDAVASDRERRRTGLRLTRRVPDRLLAHRPGCAHRKVPARGATAARVAREPPMRKAAPR